MEQAQWVVFTPPNGGCDGRHIWTGWAKGELSLRDQVRAMRAVVSKERLTSFVELRTDFVQDRALVRQLKSKRGMVMRYIEHYDVERDEIRCRLDVAGTV